VRTLPLICSTLGFCERSCKNSGWRVSNFSARRLENMTEPTNSEPGPTRGLASRSTARRNISKTAVSMDSLTPSSTLPGPPDIHHLLPESVDGIGVLPELDLFLGAVAGSVGGRVTADAVGDGIQQDWAAAFFKDPPLAPEGVDDRQRVVAVDALGVHLLGVDAGADARDELTPMVSPKGWPPMP